MKPGLLRGEREAETVGDLLARAAFEIALHVDLSRVGIVALYRALQRCPQPLAGQRDVRLRAWIRRAEATILERRQLDERLERLPFLQLPADAAADLRQPRPERRRVA